MAGAFLDAVNASAVGLMAAITVEFGRSTLTDWGAWLIGFTSATVLFRYKINSAWLVL